MVAGGTPPEVLVSLLSIWVAIAPSREAVADGAPYHHLSPTSVVVLFASGISRFFVKFIPGSALVFHATIRLEEVGREHASPMVLVMDDFSTMLVMDDFSTKIFLLYGIIYFFTITIGLVHGVYIYMDITIYS